jgi:FAD/FMN-containing dehydrogenase
VVEGGLMIDLSRMRSVSVDPAARTARCGGGATWADLDGATQAHGLAVTGGFISHTGVGGLTLGGGMGWLTPKASLSCDNLVWAEVVTADGRVLRTSADENPDLFWAIRGGGGNFGAVSTFEFSLHEVGPLVQLGLFFWGMDRAADGLRVASRFMKDRPVGTGAFIAGMSAPPAPFVPEHVQGTPGFALIAIGWGSPEQHADLVDPIRAAVEPAAQLVTPIPYTELQRMFDEAAPWGLHAYEKALYLDELTDRAIDVLVDGLPRKTSPLSFIPMLPLDHAYTRHSDHDCAFGGRREPCLVVNVTGCCPLPEMFDAERDWVRSLWEALRPHARNAGSYVNFMAEIEQDRVRTSYGPEKYDRLARIKAEYDPDNVFHLNANIKPAVPAV